ncbi:MAG: four helix bundle protein [Melioribacter sp.]|nr:four helix bundle protein [Melioribacter sp.]
MEETKNKLSERLFRFVINVLKLLRKIKFTESNRVIIYQLSKSSTSSGANYEEAQAGSSKADFNNKVNIALKEMRETNYWLRIIKELQLVSDEETELLINESEELKKILGTIVLKTK